jgi:hypothetical protein
MPLPYPLRAEDTRLFGGGGGYRVVVPKDRDQLTPAEPDDAEHLATKRGQGTAGTGRDLLPEEGVEEDEGPAPDRSRG